MPEGSDRSDTASTVCVKPLRRVFLCLGLIVGLIAALIIAIVYLVAHGWFETHVGIFIVVVLLVSLAVGLTAGIVIGRRRSRPLERLAEQADEFATGDYAVNFTADDGSTEMRELATSMEAITRSTSSALTELRLEEQRQRQFVSDVSHEIRTPLTGIRGNAETLLDPDMPAEDREHFVTTIMNECDRLTRLANALLELQRIEAEDRIDLARVDLRALVENTVDTLEPLLESRGKQVSICGEAPDVLGDSDMLTQVIVNLVENASRYADKNIHIELSGLSGHSVITVTDDGPGFGNIDPTRLFDRFYRGDRSRASATGGSGLGLAIVKSVVAAHDGTVEAFNVPNGGACFVVGIPSIAPQ